MLLQNVRYILFCTLREYQFWQPVAQSKQHWRQSIPPIDLIFYPYQYHVSMKSKNSQKTERLFTGRISNQTSCSQTDYLQMGEKFVRSRR